MACIFCNPNPDRIIVGDCVIRGISILTNSFWEDVYLDICNEGYYLQTQINLANMQASQTAQTAKILADNAAQTQALEQYLNPVPIPAYMVQNPNCCGSNWYSTCGCNSVA